MSWVCEKCGEQFDNQAVYKSHKIDHVMGRVPEKSVEELTGAMSEEEKHEKIMAEPIVVKPTKKAQKRTSEPKGDEIPSKEPEPEWRIAKRRKEPIKLVYKYEGYCNDCGGELDTLELDDVLEDKKKIVVVGWCASCKKKVRQRQVYKL